MLCSTSDNSDLRLPRAGCAWPQVSAPLKFYLKTHDFQNGHLLRNPTLFHSIVDPPEGLEHGTVS